MLVNEKKFGMWPFLIYFPWIKDTVLKPDDYLFEDLLPLPFTLTKPSIMAAKSILTDSRMLFKIALESWVETSVVFPLSVTAWNWVETTTEFPFFLGSSLLLSMATSLWGSHCVLWEPWWHLTCQKSHSSDWQLWSLRFIEFPYASRGRMHHHTNDNVSLATSTPLFLDPGEVDFGDQVSN